MSNQDFFLELCNKGFLNLINENPTFLSGGIVRYEFSYLDGNAPYFIYFNQIGGYTSNIEKAY